MNSLKDILKPPPRLTISERADKFYYIPDDQANAEPGKYHLSRMPWQAAMLDDPLDPKVREVFWMMASQFSGKTLCFTFITQYRAENGMSTIVIYPTIDSAKKWIKKKAEPTFRAAPCTRGILQETRKRDANSTMLDRSYPGGSLTMLGANSPSAFRGTTADGVLQDEIDAYEDGDEGDPCALGDRAAETFSNPVKLKASTPKLTISSRIAAGYESGDKQKYFVPCPICGHFQHLETERLKFSFTEEEHKKLLDGRENDYQWEIGDFLKRDIEKAIYVCIACQKGWHDTQRIKSIMSGHGDNPPVILNGLELRARWQATAPFQGIRSRHLNGMYAIIGLKQEFKSYLHMFADKFLTAKRGGLAKLQVWTNTFKTEPYEDPAEKIDWKQLFERREEYGPELPDQVMLITFTMDVQADRVEIMSQGWGHEQEMWVLDHNVIYGDFDMPEMRERVKDHLLKKRFTHRIIGELGYEIGGIDSAFQSKKGKAVYRFCKEQAMRNFFAIRGVAWESAEIYTVRHERAFNIKVFNLNGNYLKPIVMNNLRNKIEAGQESRPNTIHFPKRPEFGERFFAGVCSEKLTKAKRADGSTKYIWQKITSSQRNEPFDLLYYAYGLYEVLRKAAKLEWIARKWKETQDKIKALEPKVQEAPKQYTEVTEVQEPVLQPCQPPKAQPRPMQQRRPNPFRRSGLWNPWRV